MKRCQINSYSGAYGTDLWESAWPNDELPRISFCGIQEDVKDISLSGRVSLTVLRTLKLTEVVHAALIKADWIPLSYS